MESFISHPPTCQEGCPPDKESQKEEDVDWFSSGRDPRMGECGKLEMDISHPGVGGEGPSKEPINTPHKKLTFGHIATRNN